jgi:signal transduction histidine kinase
MKCPQCAHENPPQAKFCLECGAPISGLPSASSYADLNGQVERLSRALSEVLNQQTATSEILDVISSSTDVQPVFQAIARNAVTLCGGIGAVVVRYDGELLHVAGHHNVSAEAVAMVERAYPRRPARDYPPGRALLDRSVVHVPDLGAATEFGASTARERGARSFLAVPLLRAGEAIGVIGLARDVVGPFPSRQVALLQTFAAQAVIAIENVRLFNETKEALEQQTATAEILRVISGSPTDVQAVFDTIIRNAVRLSGAAWAIVTRVDAGFVHLVAHHNLNAEVLARFRNIWPHPVTGPGPTSRVVRTGEYFRVADINSEHCGLSADALADFRARGIRSMVVVPMFRQGRVVGTINLTHRAVAAFSDAHVALITTFADQAVIAIENVRLFNELALANRGLKAASQHKSEFLANMSHELRTPLNAVIGFSEVLRERMFGELNEKQEEYLNDIHASGQHLLSLINDILDLSKIEAGRMELEVADFHLPAALDNALTLVRERAGRHGIALHAAIDDRIEYIRADERKIKQVLLNLLSNAIKFTPDAGRIDARAALGEGVIEVSVTDTGVGIAPEDQEAIFEEFQQVGTAAKKIEGTGLGLALSRKFIELHGGRIWVKSQIGAGSTFTFTIPLRHGGPGEEDR